MNQGCLNQLNSFVPFDNEDYLRRARLAADQSLRLECLKLAVGICQRPQDVVRIAGEMTKFVINSEPKAD